MAINGNGFFAVQQKTGETDGKSVFGGATLYTRRGDFDVDKDGYLVNGAGDYLDGLPIDPSSGNVSGSVPTVIKISNALLPALATTTINYQLNLPEQPQDTSFQSGVAGSDLLQPGDYLPAPPATTPATATGSTTLTGTAAASTAMPAGTTLTVTAGSGSPITFNFYDSTVTTPAPTNGVDVTAGTTVAQALSSIQSQLQAMGGNTATATVGLDGAGNAQVTLGSDLSDTLTVADTTGSTGLGLGTQTVSATGPAATGRSPPSTPIMATPSSTSRSRVAPSPAMRRMARRPTSSCAGPRPTARQPGVPTAGTCSTCRTAPRPPRSRCGPMSGSTTPSPMTAR